MFLTVRFLYVCLLKALDGTNGVAEVCFGIMIGAVAWSTARIPSLELKGVCQSAQYIGLQRFPIDALPRDLHAFDYLGDDVRDTAC
jgi:hypothetical protein